MKDKIPPPSLQGSTPIDCTEIPDDTNTTMDTETDGMEHDGVQNIDLMLSVEEQEKLKQGVLTLGMAFIEDVQERMKQMDVQYLTGLKKFLQSIWTQLQTQNQPSLLLLSLLHYYTLTFLHSLH